MITERKNKTKTQTHIYACARARTHTHTHTHTHTQCYVFHLVEICSTGVSFTQNLFVVCFAYSKCVAKL